MITADKVLSEDQLNRLIKTMKAQKERSLALIQATEHARPADVRNVVDYFLFALISMTGLRISEAINLRKDDVHSDFLVIRAEISKNGKAGTVYFGPKTHSLIRDFLEVKRTILKRDQWDLLFSLSGKPPSRCYLHTRFKGWLRMANLPTSFSIHSLRHSYATQCLDAGLSLTFVRDNLRHSNVSITSQYLHLTKENREKVKDLF